MCSSHTARRYGGRRSSFAQLIMALINLRREKETKQDKSCHRQNCSDVSIIEKFYMGGQPCEVGTSLAGEYTSDICIRERFRPFDGRSGGAGSFLPLPPPLPSGRPWPPNGNDLVRAFRIRKRAPLRSSVCCRISLRRNREDSVDACASIFSARSRRGHSLRPRTRRFARTHHPHHPSFSAKWQSSRSYDRSLFASISPDTATRHDAVSAQHFLFGRILMIALVNSHDPDSDRGNAVSAFYSASVKSIRL